ncbi:hypothetical protein AWENTII_008178 [Aspergillus wentii]
MDLFKDRIERRSRHTFQADARESKLEAIRLCKSSHDIADITSQIVNASQIELWKRIACQHSQLFIIRQRNTWARLGISKELFQKFLDTYFVFPDIWKSIFALGFKLQENEFMFPGPCSKHSTTNQGEKYDCCYEIDRLEISYILRRVELNGRKCGPGESPWSIRQTAVYHQLGPRDDGEQYRSVYLLISPSPDFRNGLSHTMNTAATEELNPWMVHGLLVADSGRGWTEYLSWIEDQLQERAQPILLATVGDKNDVNLTNYKFRFDDIQDLKHLENSISSLQVILPTMLENITRVREICHRYCSRVCSLAPPCDCGNLLEEFDDNIDDTKRNIQRVQVLKERMESTTRLLTDLLSYEEANAMKGLAEESQEEGKVMSLLAFQSTKDAAAVKVLTVISLIYLPTTIVANFFSTEFVSGSNGSMQISPQVWILAAVSVPLTIITVALWWLCVRFASPLHQRYRSDSLVGGRDRRNMWRMMSPRGIEDIEQGFPREIAEGSPRRTAGRVSQEKIE